MVAFEAGRHYVGSGHNKPVDPYDLLPNPYRKFRMPPKVEKLVFTNGCFDVITPNHVRYLAWAKAQGSHLVVGINSDASVMRLKGSGRPWMSLNDRMEVLAALDVVDYVVSFEGDSPLDLINQLDPALVVKGGDYTSEQVISGGRPIKIAPLFAGLHSSSYISKIGLDN